MFFFVKESYRSTSIFSFTVNEKAFQRLSCTVIGKGDTSKHRSELDNKFFLSGLVPIAPWSCILYNTE